MATEVLVPPLGQTVDSVTLVAWHKNEGESVQQGEMLFAIETDKATLDIEAPATGVLREVTASPGDEVQVLSTIAVLVTPGEAVGSKRPDRGRKTTAPAPVPEASKRQPRPIADRIFVSPRARRLAAEHGLSLKLLIPTGPEGAIIERDVLAYLDGQIQPKVLPGGAARAHDARLGQPLRAESAPRERVVREGAVGTPRKGELPGALPTPAVRATIGERITHSVTSAANMTLNAEADATALVGLRRQLASDGVEVSYNALLLYTLGRALRDQPRFNASLVEDSVQFWEKVNIGLIVDSDQGLLMPVIRDVNHKRLAQLEGESRSLAERARLGQCSPQELSGETFILANLGIFGIDSFTPSIHPCRCAILGVGRIKTQQSPSGSLVAARQTMWLSLGFDRRVGDDALAVRFMQRVVQLIEHPYLLLS